MPKSAHSLRDKRQSDTKPRRDRGENEEKWPANRPILWPAGGQVDTPATRLMVVEC